MSSPPTPTSSYPNCVEEEEEEQVVGGGVALGVKLEKKVVEVLDFLGVEIPREVSVLFVGVGADNDEDVDAGVGGTLAPQLRHCTSG